MSPSAAPTLSRDEVFEIVTNNLKRSDFALLEYKITAAGESPVGFNGEHKKIEAKVLLNGQTKKLLYFVKHLPSLESYREYLEINGCFYKEVETYRTYLEDAKNARKKFGVCEKWHSDCFYCRGKDVIVLEDLTMSGYYMYPERALLDEEHVLLSLEAMSRMHSSSIIFEHEFNQGNIRTKSEKFAQIPDESKTFTYQDVYEHITFETEFSDDPNHPGNRVYEVGIASQAALIDLLPGYNSEERLIIAEKLQPALRRVFQLVKTSKKFKNVLVHGDLWTNNFLFRKDENCKVDNAVIIDFQLTRFAPPGQDVTMFLHLVQNREYRDKNRSRLLQYYYQAFSKELETAGLNADQILPWNEFLESCDFYEELALQTAVLYFQMIIAPGSIIDKFINSPEQYKEIMMVDRSQMLVECFKNDEIYAVRMTESMKEYIEKYILV